MKKAKMGANWKVDKSNLIVEKCIEAELLIWKCKSKSKKFGNGQILFQNIEKPLHTPRTDLIKRLSKF